MADIALIMAEDYLSNNGSGTRSRLNVNTKEGKGHPRSQVTEGILTQIRRLKARSDAHVQGVATPLSTALLQGFFSA